MSDDSPTRHPAALTSPSRPNQTAPLSQQQPSPGEMTLGNYLVGLSARMAVLFGLYVLSIGPMFWMWHSGKFGNGYRIVAAFYEPLFRLANIDDPLHIGETIGEWLNYYIGLWIQ